MALGQAGGERNNAFGKSLMHIDRPNGMGGLLDDM